MERGERQAAQRKELLEEKALWFAWMMKSPEATAGKISRKGGGNDAREGATKHKTCGQTI